MILAGDIGGTKTNLAYFTAGGDTLTPTLVESYASHEFSSLPDVLKTLVRDHPAKIEAAAFGIAGPIVNGRSKLTNLGWDVDAREVASFLKLNNVGLLNDLEATAYGTLRLHSNDKVLLKEGTGVPHAAIAVIAAGTGLGEGGLVWDGSRYRALPSEGGHTDFAPRSELEIDVLRFMLGKHERVSYERLVSGPGLLNLYQFFRSRSTYDEPSWLKEKLALGDPSAAISRAAMEGNDDVSVKALEMFVSLYGAEAGNLALKLLATGGVFVGGGIAPKILPKIQQGPFLNSFSRKGRYSDLLKKIPIHVIMNDKIALVGAAHYALIMND
jgi:glucokinase